MDREGFRSAVYLS